MYCFMEIKGLNAPPSLKTLKMISSNFSSLTMDACRLALGRFEIFRLLLINVGVLWQRLQMTRQSVVWGLSFALPSSRRHHGKIVALPHNKTSYLAFFAIINFQHSLRKLLKLDVTFFGVNVVLWTHFSSLSERFS